MTEPERCPRCDRPVVTLRDSEQDGCCFKSGDADCKAVQEANFQFVDALGAHLRAVAGMAIDQRHQRQAALAEVERLRAELEKALEWGPLQAEATIEDLTERLVAANAARDQALVEAGLLCVGTVIVLDTEQYAAIGRGERVEVIPDEGMGPTVVRLGPPLIPG